MNVTETINIGDRFGRLIVVSRQGSKHGKSQWLCKCDCGNEKLIISTSLTRVNNNPLNGRLGGTKTCGNCNSRAKYLKEYQAWSDMRQRCNNSNHSSFVYYGGRGITHCTEWNDFLTFIKDMGNCPPGYSLDRIDNNGNYEPNNCKWSSWTDQMKNRRFHNQYDH